MEYLNSFQDPEYHETHKNNFYDSARIMGFEVFNNLLIDSATSFVKYGILYLNDGIYCLKIPAGLRVYHGSRALTLNINSDYPIYGYDNDYSKEENFNYLSVDDPKRYDYDNFKNDGYLVSFYSTPPNSEGYLYKLGDGTDLVSNAYRYTQDDEIVRRVSFKNVIGRDIESMDTVYDMDNFPHIRSATDFERYPSGFLTYKTTKDVDLVFLTADYLLGNTDNIDRIKNKAIGYLQSIGKYDDKFEKCFDSTIGTHSQSTENNLRTSLIKSYGHLSDRELLTKYYNESMKNVQRILDFSSSTIYGEYKKLLLDLKGTKRLTDSQVSRIFEDYKHIPILRYSTFVDDKYLFGILSEVFEYVDGIISSDIYNLFYKFDGEFALFYSPYCIDRDRDNFIDVEYGLGFGGFYTEMRKYIVSSLCDDLGGFCHTGHLFEHSSWTYLWANHYLDTLSSFSELYIKDMIAFTSLFHDIGKMGSCGFGNVSEQYQNFYNIDVYEGDDYSSIYFNYEDKDYKINECWMLDNGTYNYASLPDHPLKGYQYFNGELQIATNLTTDLDKIVFKDFKQYALKLLQKYNIQDPESFLTNSAVLVACHYGAGIYLFSNDETTESQDLLRISFERWIKEVMFYYNSHFLIEEVQFKNFLKILLIISGADISAQRYYPPEYNPNYTNSFKTVVNAEFPNTMHYNSDPGFTPAEIENKIRFWVNYIDNFSVFSNVIYNTYTIYSNIVNLINEPVVFQNMFEEFPSIISFDWDQTLSQNNSVQEHCDGTFTGYNLMPTSVKIINSLQSCRPKTRIGIVSRHYFGIDLFHGLERQGLLDKLDFVCSVCTGGPLDSNYLRASRECPHLNERNDFYYFEDSGLELVPRSVSSSLDITKRIHFDKIREKYGVDFNRFLHFDDEERFMYDPTAIQLEITVYRVPYDFGVVNFNQILGKYCYERVLRKKMLNQ